ncbi:hypothetical protein Droror1_Dr00022281 [Drosera rotundifolia]
MKGVSKLACKPSSSSRRSKPLRTHGKPKGIRVCEVSRRRRADRVEKKVKTLMTLIPNKSSSTSLEELYTTTACYITSLEMRVRIMMSLIDALHGALFVCLRFYWFLYLWFFSPPT